MEREREEEGEGERERKRPPREMHVCVSTARMRGNANTASTHSTHAYYKQVMSTYFS